MSNDRQSHFQPVTFTERSMEISKSISTEADILMKNIALNIPDCREKSIAITKLEESIMWSNKAIAIAQEKDKNEIN